MSGPLSLTPPVIDRMSFKCIKHKYPYLMMSIFPVDLRDGRKCLAVDTLDILGVYNVLLYTLTSS